MNQYDIAIASAKELKKDYILFSIKDRYSFEYENANEKLQRSLAEMDVYIKRVENNHARAILEQQSKDFRKDLEYISGSGKLDLIDQMINTFSSVPILEYLHPNK
jgi:molecular chaperone GrpE (heat shock protein)